jgi:signal transduction histidine kinase
MRTPLTAARLEVERLGRLAHELETGRDGIGDEIGARVAGLIEELERLAAFTRRFTSFARLPRPQPEPASLTALAADFAAAFGDAWPELTIEIEEPAETPEPADGEAPGDDLWTVLVDREMLRQVLVNLCDNSAHAAGEGGGRVTLRPVAVPDSAGGGFAGLEVADDGPGLPPEVERRLFEPYLTTRRVGEGMGLGLAIARKILLDHGGDLELAASGPGGATFRLTLPAAAAAEGAAA